MIRHLLTLLALICSLAGSAFAQVQDDRARLMQEYMARRAEWVELRRAALEKVKVAKDEKEKKQHRDKLADEERPVLERMAEAARAYQALEQADRARREEGKPRG